MNFSNCWVNNRSNEIKWGQFDHSSSTCNDHKKVKSESNYLIRFVNLSFWSLFFNLFINIKKLNFFSHRFEVLDRNLAGPISLSLHNLEVQTLKSILLMSWTD